MRRSSVFTRDPPERSRKEALERAAEAGLIVRGVDSAQHGFGGVAVGGPPRSRPGRQPHRRALVQVLRRESHGRAVVRIVRARRVRLLEQRVPAREPGRHRRILFGTIGLAACELVVAVGEGGERQVRVLRRRTLRDGLLELRCVGVGERTALERVEYRPGPARRPMHFGTSPFSAAGSRRPARSRRQSLARPRQREARDARGASRHAAPGWRASSKRRPAASPSQIGPGRAKCRAGSLGMDRDARGPPRADRPARRRRGHSGSGRCPCAGRRCDLAASTPARVGSFIAACFTVVDASLGAPST